ncbi:hypothetical protein QF035_009227 [Streptomyces umbrinus]|uniref:Uncharacterized protein n=1 Tax=Streptomyces umbrinus TaxID=67370 RepID=A0ABU0T759_9ACTN|nr:hypothetical protein [Streptomyces umbrinus]MDQ1031645.1 hypothetical protein [Streptomyces umbrinus]
MTAVTTPPYERGRLITRYSLTTSPLYPEVHNYLAPLNLPASSAADEQEPDHVFGRMLVAVRRECHRYEAVAEALRRVAAFTEDSLSEEYVTAFFRIRSTADDLVSTYVSTVYARALIHLGREPDTETFPQYIRGLLAQPVPALARLRAVLDACPEDFVGHMVAEAVARRGENPFFRERLDHAQVLFEQYSGPAASWQEPDAQSLSEIGTGRLDHPAALPAHMALVMTLYE